MEERESFELYWAYIESNFRFTKVAQVMKTLN